MGAQLKKQLDVRGFYASPRHSWWLLSQEDEQEKIFHHVQDMLTNTQGSADRRSDQAIIINIRKDPPIVEIHDGNASTVAWVLYRRIRGLWTSWEEF